MNFRVYIMALATVAVGLVELIVGGILPAIADDLNVSLSQAGQLITVFALVFAITGPILYVATSRIERKKLYIGSMVVFIIGNVLMYFSDTFLLMMLARIVSAASTALVVILSLTMAGAIVKPGYQARAIGVVYMGISSALVLGVPIGVLIAEHLGWRVIFLIISGLALFSMMLIAWAFEPMPGRQAMPMKQQLKSLKNAKLLSAHVIILLMLAGHFVLYAYFAPFLREQMGFSSEWVSIAYFLFGLAAVTGGLVGGSLSDRIGHEASILLVLLLFAASMFVLPLTTAAVWVFFPMMMLWGGLSWALSPAIQSYIITNDPQTAEVQQSFNNSALQIGISCGSAIGGAVIAYTGDTSHMAYIGGGFVVLALLVAFYSVRKPSRWSVQAQSELVN